MESAGEDLDNIFEDYESRENGEANGMRSNEESNETSAGVKIQPIKRVVKNPRLKFNPERLCGERGIPVLVDHFKNVKFKGKGYEKEDLDKLLSKLEHWTHRLFPSMKFEDCLHHIEKLGQKRPVQTCLRKLRLNMPILDNDFVKDDEEDNVQRNEDPEPVEIDPFDRLFGENQNNNAPTTTDNEIDSSFSISSSSAQRELFSESGGQVLGSSGSNLTEEQREKLERNRMLAVERRKARLAAAQQNATESLIERNERTSQDDPIVPPLGSPSKNKTNMFDDLFTHSSYSHSNENDKSILLSNPNSDNLGLDDLVALVDGEELDSDKRLAISSPEQSAICVKQSTEATDELSQASKLSNLKQTVSCSASTDTNSSITLPAKVLGFDEDKNLELESLIDVINDNSEECQQYSDSVQSKSLTSEKGMSSPMDCEDEGSLKISDSESSSLAIVEHT